MKKVLATILALAMIAAMAVPACADNTEITSSEGTASVPITLSTTAATFSVTVPTGFPVSVAADGKVTCATNLKITNNSKGQIKVSKIKISGQNGWSLVDYNTDFTKVATDSKQFGFQIKDKNVCGDSTSENYGIADVSGYGPINGGGSTLEIPYDASVAVQSSAMTGSEIALVVFTIGWNT